ncbi:Na(+)/H(+) antiporter subunit E [bacterium HR17]|uniref:Na(+)/H(+) antiporter subunit E n=1 Tax=Candidatus Fervidibacter japonicus TaxID=2035412 RepID=A0A2H5X996_9BACT|nr:Na(+)/H(+) antiporter subunit E [bacterium HR17]
MVATTNRQATNGHWWPLRLRALAALGLLWCLLTNRLTAGEFVLGVMFGAVVLWLTKGFRQERIWLKRGDKAVLLLLEFLKQMLIANLQVARIVLSPKIAVRPALFVVPLELDNDVAITALGDMITLTPGTLTVDVAPDRSALFVHCLHTDDVALTRNGIKVAFERPLKEVLQCLPKRVSSL